MLKCDQCTTAYIGQTRRALKQRFREHLRINNTRSGFAQHLREHGHTCSEQEGQRKLIHQETKLGRLLMLERYEIVIHEGSVTLVNEQITQKDRPLYKDLKFPLSRNIEELQNSEHDGTAQRAASPENDN